MKLANGLSLLRVVLTLPIVSLMLWQAPRWMPVAAGLFLVAGLSDYLDGYFARRRNAVSTLGVFIDLVADKLLTSTVLVAFVDLGILPTWPVAVIIAREFLITGLRQIAASAGVVIPAAAWGKQKTFVTTLALLLLMLGAGSQLQARGGEGGWAPILGDLGIALFYLAVLLTVTSGIMYLYTARGVFRRLVA